MKKIALYSSLFLTALLLVWACRKEKPELGIGDKDPCGCASEVSADFVIEENIPSVPTDYWIETDTILKDKSVRFSALEEDALEYKWYIGSEILYGKSVTRLFLSQWAGSDIPITLVVKKAPNNTCFPNDDGYDSINKSFHVSQYLIRPGIFDEDRTVGYGGMTGTYRVIREGLTDSVEINVYFADPLDNNMQIGFDNIDGLGTNCPCTDLEYWAKRRAYRRAYRFVSFGESNSDIDSNFCFSLSGTILRRMDGIVEFDVLSRIQLILNGPITDTHFKYRGRKIN